jgi:hypothetical protein
MRTRRRLIFVLLAAGALAGCAPAASAAPRPVAVPQAPAPVLGGDCAELFPDPFVSQVLGTAVAVQDLFLDAPIQHAVPAIGGLSCEWTSVAEPDGSVDAPSLSVVVLNRASATEPKDVTCATGAVTATSVDAIACRFSVIEDGLWLSGVAYAPTGTAEDTVRTRVAALSDSFRTLQPDTEPAEPDLGASESAWVAPDCSELSRAADIAGTLQSPDLVGNDVAVAGAESAEGVLAAQTAAGAFACAWYHSGRTPTGQLDGFTIQGLPGGAWAQTEVLAIPGARVVDIPGVELAVRVPTAAGHDQLDVFDGVNWLQVAASQALDPVLPALPGLLDALAAGPGPSRS